MNLFPRTFVLCLLAASSPWAAAASTVDLTVKGLITPSACTPQLSNAGTVDHGKIAFRDLNPTSLTQLPRVGLQVNVDCDAQTLMALQATDNRVGSGAHGSYGLSLINGTTKLGFFQMTIANVVADNAVVEAIYSIDGSSDWMWQDPDTAWMPDYFIAPSLSTAKAPIPVQNLSADVVVYTYINRSDSLPGSEEITLDGSATITVRYL